MMRRNFIRPSFLEGAPILNIPSLKFHLTPKILARSVFRRNIPNNVEKHTESEPPKSFVNFLGIESEEGVIATGSKANFTQQNVLKGKVKERFHVASFGVIRYDSENKLKFHGQYAKTCDVFPHNNNEYSTVSDNLTKTISSHNQKYNGFEVNRLGSSAINSKTYDDDTIRSIDALNKESPDHANSTKDGQEINYVDEYCLNNSHQICNDLEVNKLDCPTISSNVFEGNSVSRTDILKETSGHNDSLKDEQNISYIDEHYFNSYKEEVQSVENCSSTSDDLNFIDQTYFGDQTVAENKKLYQDQNIFQNTPFVNEKDTEYIEKFYSDDLKSNNFEGERLNSIQNNESSQKYAEVENIVQDAFFSQANISDKRENANPKNIISKEFSIKNGVNMKSYIDSNNIKNNLSMETNNFKPKRSTVELNETSSDRVKYSNYDSQSMEPFINVKDSKHLKINSEETDAVEPFINVKDSKHSKINSEETDAVGSKISAYDFVQDLRKQNNIPKSDLKKGSTLDIAVDSKGFRILKNQVNDLSNFTQDEIFNILKQNVLYSDDDLMILNKPYSLVIHESQTTKSPCLSAFLDKLANEGNKLNSNPKLYTVHRLDKETTGCLLLARNEIMAQHLKSLFAQRKIIKKYWILTSRVPDPPEGVIDIPIAEGSINNKKRMVLHPEIPKDIAYKNHSKRGKPAVTSYKVLKESGNAALVEATPITGIKHQIRVHFGFGLSCPILGDHKYSHLDKLAPQKLPSDILQRLHVRQSKVRYIPLHIHAKSVTIPGYFEGRDLHVKAPLPDHMKENLKMLKFKK